MDAAKQILNIISPWATKSRAVLSEDRGFIDKKDIKALRNYAYEMRKLPSWYKNVCFSLLHHRSLRILILSTGYFKKFEASSQDWETLEKLLSGAVDDFLQQSGTWLSNGREILALVEKMDIMEQLDCTIGDLTEEKLRELRSRPLSQRDLDAVGGVQYTLKRMLTVVRVTQKRVYIVNKTAEHFSDHLATIIFPALEQLYKASLADRCRNQPCYTYLLYADAVLNNLVNHERVHASASALNDLQVALSNYLQSKVSELSGMHTDLAVLFFAVQFKGVLDVWQTVDGMLQATQKALQ